METGKALRIRRFFRRKRTVIIPLDHALYSGPVKGIEDPKNLVKVISQSEAEGILVTPGILMKIKDVIGNLAVVLRIDGTHTRLGSHLERIELISTVETALKLGADMVAINVFVGTENEDILLKKLGIVSTACLDWGMPLMAEMIPASTLSYHYGKKEEDNADITDDIKLVARLGAEIGADIIKTHYTGSIESFKEVVDTATVPIVIAGGPKVSSDEEFIKLVEEISISEASGICIGRNIWQAKDPKKMLKAVCTLIHGETNETSGVHRGNA
jgi:DhnA family fructose-bisphosphate aldolase class Ia